jgi:hypothetical protein
LISHSKSSDLLEIEKREPPQEYFFVITKANDETQGSRDHWDRAANQAHQEEKEKDGPTKDYTGIVCSRKRLQTNRQPDRSFICGVSL